MLFESYVKLVNDYPRDRDHLFGNPLAEDSSLWLAVDHDAYPALLFASRREEVRNDVELRSISVHFSRDCVIEAHDGYTNSGVYTAVCLRENDPDVVRMVLRLLGETFNIRNRPFTNKEIAARILELADLFRQIGESVGDVVGLWGELYILSCSSNLETAVRSWCINKNAKYDYVTEQFVLEAKTTLLSRRKHRFTLDQLRPIGEFSVYVASLVVVEVDAGRTAVELMDELYDKICDDDLRARFLAQCLVKGGRDMYLSTLKLGAFPDGTSLVVFDATRVLVPIIPEDSFITNVRFDVDLTDLSPISRREMATVLAFGSG